MGQWLFLMTGSILTLGIRSSCLAAVTYKAMRAEVLELPATKFEEFLDGKTAAALKLKAGDLVYFPSGWVVQQETIDMSVMLKWSVFPDVPDEAKKVLAAATKMVASFPSMGTPELTTFMTILQQSITNA